MNKQEFIEKIKGYGAWCTECHDIHGEKDRYVKVAKVRELLEQLDELEADKVEVPRCMGEFLDRYRDKDETAMSHIMIEFTESENFSDFVEFPLSDYPMGWDRLMASALLHGYTIKETLWAVKDLDDEYVSDVCLHQPDKVYNSSDRERSEILIFTDRAKAEAVATLVEGSVEEID